MIGRILCDELPASITDRTKTAISRRTILTSFRDSSNSGDENDDGDMTEQLYCGLIAHLYRLTTRLLQA